MMKDKKMVEDENVPETADDSPSVSFSLPDRVPVVMSGEGVGQMLDSMAGFIDDHSKVTPFEVEDPITGAVAVSFLNQSGVHALPDSFFEEARGFPRFRKGTSQHTSLDSLIAMINRFGDADSAVFANDNRTAPSLLAVLDYNRRDTLKLDNLGDEASDRVHGDYRFGKHRAAFSFPVSDEWTAWHAHNSHKMSMTEFAMFLEDNVLDVADVEATPESAKRFVEMNGGPSKIADWSVLNRLAKSLTIYDNAICTEAINLSSGEGVLTLTESHETEVAGIKATVPTMFFIAIPIFREGVVYRLPVRLRYRKERGGVVFWYELWRADRAFTDAFHEAVGKVQAQTEAQVFFGSPE